MKLCLKRSSLLSAQKKKREEKNSGDEYVKLDIHVDSGLAGPDGAWATHLVWVMHFEL